MKEVAKVKRCSYYRVTLSEELCSGWDYKRKSERNDNVIVGKMWKFQCETVYSMAMITEGGSCRKTLKR